MKVERDFYVDSSGCEVYEWRATVEGEVLSYSTAISFVERQYGRTPPLEYLERNAQRMLLDDIGKKLFGSRFN